MAGDEGPTGPERAFSLLSDETRLAILDALRAADKPLAFSELRERIGNPDSGQFNYHLDALQKHFVTKTSHGYRLTGAGREVVRAILAGSITDRPCVKPGPIDGECTTCGATLVVEYDGRGIIECPDCGETVMWNEFPPAGLKGRSATELASALDAWVRYRFSLAMAGVCPNCASQTEAELDDGTPEDVATLHRCSHCGYEARVPLIGHLIRHPAVVSFFHDHGIDVMERPYWRLQQIEFDLETVETGPWAARVTLWAGRATLSLVVNDRLEITVRDSASR